MNKTQKFYRIGMWTVVLVVILSLLAISLPQPAQAASANNTLPNNASYSAYERNGRVYLTTAGFPERSKFKVRVKDASISQPKFYNLGWLIAEKKTNQTTSFALPKALKGAIWLDVCLKDQRNDKLFCKKVYNAGG